MAELTRMKLVWATGDFFTSWRKPGPGRAIFEAGGAKDGPADVAMEDEVGAAAKIVLARR